MPCAPIKIVNFQPILERILVLPLGVDVPPNPRTYKALVDTGAMLSGISSRLAKSMKLGVKEKIKMQSATGEELRDVYSARLVFIELDVEVREAALTDFYVGKTPNYDLIIGMNILLNGSLSINSRTAGGEPTSTFCIDPPTIAG